MAGYKPGSKTYILLGLIFIITMVTVIYIVQYQTNSIISQLISDRVQAASHNLTGFFSELENRASGRAELISYNEAFITALKSRDHDTLKRVLFNFTLGLDFAIVCDSNGIVLARSHNYHVGDDITRYRAVSAVLRTGIASTSIEVIESNGSRLSIYASVPVFDQGSLIGVINCYYDLTKNNYVDEFKERTGCEASIFLYDKRISTTITDKFGNRITGEKAYDFIVETVIKQKKEYMGNLELFDKVYGGCYTPLMIDNEVIGMLFAGVDIHSPLESQRGMNMWIILASLIGIVASAAFIVVSRINTKKYSRLSDKQLSQQILMADISRRFLSDLDTNTLIRDTLRMVGEFMELSQLLLFMLEEDGVTLTCNDEWMDPKFALASRIGSKLPLKGQILPMIKNLTPGIGKDSCLHSDDPVIKKAMAPYRVSFVNYISTPIFNKGELIGVLDFSKGGKSQIWSDSDISLATHFASTLSGVFERELMGRQTSIVENSPHMIFYATSNGIMAYANPVVSTVTGYSPAELKTGGFGLILDEQALRDVKEVYVPQTLKRKIVRHEVTLKCKDGRMRILGVTSFLVKDDLTAAICIDMTDMRAMESELINAKNRADRASRAKSEFLSNMSHEMRTPMNAIIGMTTIAKNTADNDRKEYALNKVEEASAHLLGIINDILDMMKIEANKLELTHVNFDLRNILQKAASFVQFRMEEKRHRFSMNVGDDVPFFFTGDDQRLTQILINLLSNAVKFTPEDGEIGLSVSLLGKASGIFELRFEVADSGIGISPEQQKKLFRMFEQAESGTTRKYGGTGLGLAISKRIIELMNGKIWVESGADKGSRFIFTALLPGTNEISLQQKSDSAAKVKNFNEDSAKTRGKKLLLAEDIEINREILVSLLDGTGLIIDIAENGKEAFEKISAAHDLYDLVFMDMQMPEMDGLEATRRIRAFEADRQPYRRIPIIAMTANVFKDDIENCVAAGMDDHIGKPLDIGTVFEKLDKYLTEP